MIDRRRPEAYRLRVYIDAIKEVESMTDAAWLDRYVQAALINRNAAWFPRFAWLEYLKACALRESESLLAASERDAA
jgi:enoyl reductase-like protein